MIECIYTIGGYGCVEEIFFSRLENSKIDILVDIRMHRGMRGSKYAFLNSAALQKKLAERGISYVHIKSLAPDKSIRLVQKQADESEGIYKRSRQELSSIFIEKYKKNVLEEASPREVIKLLEGHSHPCFFCVESAASACHRSLVANWMQRSAGVVVKHLGEE